MNAVIQTGGKQFNVKPGDIIYAEKLPQAEGETVTITEVLAVFDGAKSKFGNPFIPKVTVECKVLKQGKQKKIVVFKMKSKKNVRRKQGHRQAYTKLEIVSIKIPD